ncbi:hypothetical protein LRS13_14690 [Svornostia abyssi]|uniref:Uncharacterized protein n=1 Tax=Svornostia abyssi TaxID=2898438 RepID=A0ABY5PBA7_9ACTN|nr:hypothetical protein LRS13_14690 [Parviterribacteraceae bacterium J379]
MRRVVPLAAAAGTLLFALSGSAWAASLDNPQASPADKTAGAHSDFTVQFNLSDLGAVGAGGDDLRSLDIDLPAGLVGDTGAAQTCPFASLQADACPAGSTVGSTNVNASVRVTPLGPILPVELDNQSINGSIFLVPTRGDRAGAARHRAAADLSDHRDAAEQGRPGVAHPRADPGGAAGCPRRSATSRSRRAPRSAQPRCRSGGSR